MRSAKISGRRISFSLTTSSGYRQNSDGMLTSWNNSFVGCLTCMLTWSETPTYSTNDGTHWCDILVNIMADISSDNIFTATTLWSVLVYLACFARANAGLASAQERILGIAGACSLQAGYPSCQNQQCFGVQALMQSIIYNLHFGLCLSGSQVGLTPSKSKNHRGSIIIYGCILTMFCVYNSLLFLLRAGVPLTTDCTPLEICKLPSLSALY